ncbi:hypothetical protein D3C80_2060660 [compost metagenome]
MSEQLRGGDPVPVEFALHLRSYGDAVPGLLDFINGEADLGREQLCFAPGLYSFFALNLLPVIPD